MNCNKQKKKTRHRIKKDVTGKVKPQKVSEVESQSAGAVVCFVAGLSEATL